MTTFADITGRLGALAIEVPSWAYGNSGTRFKVFGTPGTPRTVHEKLADAAKVHELTGLAPTVALHIPWDKVDDYAALKEFAAELGVGLGTINSNTFQDDEYKFGSLTSSNPVVRRRAIDHHLECLEIMNATGWQNYSLFLRPDGLLIGYVETPSIEAAVAGMAATDVNARWQAEMAEFFEDLDLPPDQGFWQLTEVFHLEDQLAALTPTSTATDTPTPTAQDQS